MGHHNTHQHKNPSSVTHPPTGIQTPLELWEYRALKSKCPLEGLWDPAQSLLNLVLSLSLGTTGLGNHNHLLFQSMSSVPISA